MKNTATKQIKQLTAHSLGMEYTTEEMGFESERIWDNSKKVLFFFNLFPAAKTKIHYRALRFSSLSEKLKWV